MAFSDVEMSILAQLAYRDVDYKHAAEEPLAELLKANKKWLNDSLGSSYEKYIDNLINKVDGSDYKIVASEHDKASGFAAYAISTPQNEVVVACRGTQMDQANDILTDVGLGITPETQQHRDMEAFVNRLEKKGYDGYYFTGHSLGGNVATHGATTVKDLDKVKGVYTYNAPGFNEAYWILNGWKLKQIKNITNFQNEYDYVSSVLRVPGRKVVIESSHNGNHAGFDDHSINGYTINGNGYFQENETGEKHPQTYTGTAVGELGNSFFYRYLPILVLNRIFGGSKGPVYVYRDFSEASREKMLGLVSQVENEKWGNFTDWIGDRWYDFESWIGTLNIRHYINNVNTYHKKVIDKNNTTEKTINEIFEAVRGVDASYATTFGNVKTSLEQWLRFVDTMTSIVEPGKGRFNGQYMAGAMKQILKDVSKANVQQIKDTLMQNISGEPVFDEELLLEYIKKDPAHMTSEEKQAVREVIEELKDTVAFYETAWSVGNDNMGASFLNGAAMVTETNAFASASAVSAHYNNVYANVLHGVLEHSENSTTFAAELLQVGDGQNILSVLGLEASAEHDYISAKATLTTYIASLKTENSSHYFGKNEGSLEAGLNIKNKKDLDDISDKFKKWKEGAEDKLEKKGLREEYKPDAEYYDLETGEQIKEKDAPDFYDRELTLGEIKAEAKAEVSVYDGTFDTPLGGTATVTVGRAEAHAEASAGCYIVGKDGERVFSPGVSAEVGASVTGFEATYENQIIGNEMIGLNADAKVTAMSASAKAEAEVNFMGKDKNGNVVFDPQVNAGVSAEAVLAEAEGSVGVNILGGEAEVKGSVKVGVGAHADIGIKDGVVKCELGASLGIGFDVGFEVDVGGMVNTVADGAKSAWNWAKSLF